MRYNGEKKWGMGIQKMGENDETSIQKNDPLSHKETPAHGGNAAQQEGSQKQKTFRSQNPQLPYGRGKKNIGFAGVPERESSPGLGPLTKHMI